jgi:hypothetical protein
MDAPPKGVWFRESIDGFRLGLSARSSAAWFLVPFMTLWSGLSLGAIYGTQIASGHFSLGASLFSIPFIVASLLFWPMALMTVVGRRELTVRGTEARYFVGFGPIGLRRHFAWSKVNSVREMKGLVLEGEVTLDLFGSPNDEQRTFLLGALRRRLISDARPEWS